MADAASQLDEMAMQYAIADAGIDRNRAESIFNLKPTTSADEWNATVLKILMHHKFGVFETQEAIKRATEIVRMVFPDQGDP